MSKDREIVDNNYAALGEEHKNNTDGEDRGKTLDRLQYDYEYPPQTDQQHTTKPTLTSRPSQSSEEQTTTQPASTLLYKGRHNNKPYSLTQSAQLSRFSPYLKTRPTLSEKMSKERQILENAIGGLSHKRQKMDGDVHPEILNHPEYTRLHWNETEPISQSTPVQTSSGKSLKFSPYSIQRPALSNKIEKQRKILANELYRLSQTKQLDDVQPESIPLPEDNWDEAKPIATPTKSSNNKLKTYLDSNRVQFKRKKNNTVNYRIIPDEQRNSLIKSSEFKTLPPSVAEKYWVSSSIKSPYAYKKFKKYTQTKKHLLDGSFKET